MTGPLNVDNDAISKAANQVLDAIEQIRTSINQVTNTSQDMKAGWQGAAYAAFAGVADSWQQEGMRLNQKIDAMNQSLRDVIAKTDASEGDNVNLFSGAHGSGSAVSGGGAPSGPSLNMPS